MVYELERVLQVCDGFFCSMSAIYDGKMGNRVNFELVIGISHWGQLLELSRYID